MSSMSAREQCLRMATQRLLLEVVAGMDFGPTLGGAPGWHTVREVIERLAWRQAVEEVLDLDENLQSLDQVSVSVGDRPVRTVAVRGAEGDCGYGEDELRVTTVAVA